VSECVREREGERDYLDTYTHKDEYLEVLGFLIGIGCSPTGGAPGDNGKSVVRSIYIFAFYTHTRTHTHTHTHAYEARRTFSKVLCIVTLCSGCSRALPYINVLHMMLNSAISIFFMSSCCTCVCVCVCVCCLRVYCLCV
jgi:hypothetical protein